MHLLRHLGKKKRNSLTNGTMGTLKAAYKVLKPEIKRKMIESILKSNKPTHEKINALKRFLKGKDRDKMFHFILAELQKLHYSNEAIGEIAEALNK